MAIFSKKVNKSQPMTGIGRIVDELKSHINGSSQINAAVAAKAAFATESLDDADRSALKGAVDSFNVAIESLHHVLKSDGLVKNELTQAQKDAAVAAGVMAGDVGSYFRQPNGRNIAATENMVVVDYTGIEDAATARSFSLEAYDERENRNAAMYSVAYNMQAARQDEFGETFYPTIVVSPDNVGFGVTVRLMMVYDEIKRQTTGALDQFNRKNVIRALADPTILKNELTRIIPVFRDTVNNAMFVDKTVIAPKTYVLEGESIPTQPLKIGAKYSLLGLSQTDALLASGVMDQTDSIDPHITLQTVYISVTDGTNTDILALNVQNLPLSNFTYSTQNNYRTMSLNFDTSSVLLNSANTTVAGAAPVALAGITTNNLILRLNLNLSGSANLQLGDTAVYGNDLSVYSVQDATGNMLDMTAAPQAAIVAMINSGKILGYDLTAYRTNMNRRQRGQLIDTTYFTQMYAVPLLSPITGLHPVNADAQTDASDLSALITATHVRTSNAAVTSLIQAANLLKDYVDARDTAGNGPDILGVGRYLIRPIYNEATIDMATSIDSLKSHERAQDIQAVLVNKIRDLAYRMYRDSEYLAAANAMAGGIAPPPTVIVGTDPVLARYLTVTGDLRTLGNEFNVRIVSTLDNRVSGKIFIAFGDFTGDVNAGPNPLHFGCMAWKPELTLTMPISRDGQISKELTVQPSFLHIVNCPLLSVINVTNVPDTLGKVTVNMHSL